MQEVMEMNHICNELIKVYNAYQIGFSINRKLGGYLHSDGSYVTENSICVTLIGNPTDQELFEYIEILKKTLNQESILVVQQIIDSEYY